jgi:hypothetical protein
MPKYPDIDLEISIVRPGQTWGVEAEIRQIAPYDTFVIHTIEGFEVCDVTVGGETQLATTDPIPAAAFAPGSLGTMRLALAARGTPIHRLPAGTRVGIKVKNVSEEPKAFKSKLVVALV